MSEKQRSSRFRLLRGKKSDKTADSAHHHHHGLGSSPSPAPEVIDAYSSSGHVTSMTVDTPTPAIVQQMKEIKAAAAASASLSSSSASSSRKPAKPDIILENVISSCDDTDPLLQAAKRAEHISVLVSGSACAVHP